VGGSCCRAAFFFWLAGLLACLLTLPFAAFYLLARPVNIKSQNLNNSNNVFTKCEFDRRFCCPSCRCCCCCGLYRPLTPAAFFFFFVLPCTRSTALALRFIIAIAKHVWMCSLSFVLTCNFATQDVTPKTCFLALIHVVKCVSVPSPRRPTKRRPKGVVARKRQKIHQNEERQR